MSPMLALDELLSSEDPSCERVLTDHVAAEPGSVIGGYRIIRLLGRGSMGVVYLEPR
jgi:hypothetical protein